MSKQQIKDWVISQFIGVYDDQWIDMEERVVIMLQDKFNMSCEEAEKFLREVF